MPYPALGSPPVSVPPNPYDVNQLVDYLEGRDLAPGYPDEGSAVDELLARQSRLSESTKLIWTVTFDLTPVYAIEAEVAYADEVYRVLRDALRNQHLPTEDDRYISRVSISGVLTSRTVTLFSGQVVPVIVAQPRGLYAWRETQLVEQVLGAVRTDSATEGADPEYVRLTIRNFLDKIYYQLRNLGQSPPDRALNFAATNIIQFAEGLQQGLLSAQLVPGPSTNLYSLDTINVVRSAFCRPDSDCWDVRVTFFDPEELMRARAVYQYTIDVSDPMPVSLAPTRQFLVGPAG